MVGAKVEESCRRGSGGGGGSGGGECETEMEFLRHGKAHLHPVVHVHRREAALAHAATTTPLQAASNLVLHPSGAEVMEEAAWSFNRSQREAEGSLQVAKAELPKRPRSFECVESVSSRRHLQYRRTPPNTSIQPFSGLRRERCGLPTR